MLFPGYRTAREKAVKSGDKKDIAFLNVVRVRPATSGILDIWLKKPSNHNYRVRQRTDLLYAY